ncbi:hypothetical protein KJ359_003986 [Pestalotiopsis sp. 9143b]|nr:hypothetical protein KJ359_003986 [Pestalotiopsis sp. 9143b]
MANELKPDAATDAKLIPLPAINTKATSSRSDSIKDSPILASHVPVARSRDHNDLPSLAVTGESSVVPSSPSFDTPQGDTVLSECLPELSDTGELASMPENDGVSKQNESGVGDDDSGIHGHERWMVNMERKMEQLTSTALDLQRYIGNPQDGRGDLQSVMDAHRQITQGHATDVAEFYDKRRELATQELQSSLTKAINDGRDATKVAMHSHGKLISDHQSSITGVLERNMGSIKTAMESRGKMMSNFQSAIIEKVDENMATTESAVDSHEAMTFEIIRGLDCQHSAVLRKIGSLPTKEDNKRIIDEHFRSVMEAIDKHKSDITASMEDMEDISAVVEQRDEQIRRIDGLKTENARLTYERDRALATLDDERRKARGYFRIRKRSLQWASTGLVALTALRNGPSVLRMAGRWSAPRVRQVAERMAAYVKDREQNST